MESNGGGSSKLDSGSDAKPASPAALTVRDVFGDSDSDGNIDMEDEVLLYVGDAEAFSSTPSVSSAAEDHEKERELHVIAEEDMEVDRVHKEDTTAQKIQEQFLKATSSQQSEDTQSLIGRKRKIEEVYANTGVKKHRVAHAGSETARPALSAQPKPKTISGSKLAEALNDPEALTMGKKRVVKPEALASQRPRIPLLANAKVPTKIRQKFLDSFIDEYMKLGVEPRQAYDKALSDEDRLYGRCVGRMVYMNLTGQWLSKLKERSTRKQSEKQKESDQRKAETSGLKKAESNGGGNPGSRSSSSQSSQSTTGRASLSALPTSPGKKVVGLTLPSPSHKCEDVKKLELSQSAPEVMAPGKGISTQGFYSKAHLVVEHSEGNGTESRVSESSEGGAAEPTVKKKKKKKKALSFEAILESVDKKVLQIKKKVSSVIQGKEATSSDSRSSTSEEGLSAEDLASGKNGKIKQGKIRAPNSAKSRSSTSEEGLSAEDLASGKNGKIKQGKIRAPNSLLLAPTQKRLRTTTEPDHGQSSSSVSGPPASSKRGVQRTPSQVSYSIVEKKEPVFNAQVFYTRMQGYLLSEEQLRENGFPMPVPNSPGEATMEIRFINRRSKIEPVGPNAMRHYCCRCNKPFIIYNNGSYQTVEKCIYHFGRLHKSRECGEGVVSSYLCCGERQGSGGCQVANMHVTAGDQPTRGTGYVQTLPPPAEEEYVPQVYSMDCEMCYTTIGMELTRVTVINEDLKSVFESLVKPSHTIVDYNTRFSGLTAEDLADVTTSLQDVQRQLQSIIYEDSILVGHSLESDLRALKMVHKNVVDTSIVFPHRMGLPYKRALRTLMVEFLQKFIQDSSGGHDSLEDSCACMELMIWKVKQDLLKTTRRSSSTSGPPSQQ